MKLFENLKAKWDGMSTPEKVKAIVFTVCDLGSSFLMSAIGEKLFSEDDGKLKKFCMKTTLFGLGAFVGNVASQEINTIIDAVTPEQKGEQNA